jgi:hypothetical protein
VKHFLNINPDLNAPNQIAMDCSKVVDFEFAEAGLETDLSSLICAFDYLMYPLVFDPNDPHVHWPYILTISQASPKVMQAFFMNNLNFTLHKDVVSLDCTGDVDLHISLG